MGNGNYVIAIEEEGKIVEALIMMDSHDRVEYVREGREEKTADAKLIPEPYGTARAVAPSSGRSS